MKLEEATVSQMESQQIGIAEAVSYAASHGIVVSKAKKGTIGKELAHAPMTYKPSPFHAPSFYHAKRITTALNLLVARIADDHAYLREHLTETAAADASFTGRLLQLLGTAPDLSNTVSLGMYRYDYFVNDQNGSLSPRMVEMNCIAASFGCLGTKTSQMHRFLASHPACDFNANLDQLPENNAMDGLANGLATAHNEYCRIFNIEKSQRSVVVMVVQPGERNAYDQDLLRTTAWEKHQVEIIRVSLVDIEDNGILQEDGHFQIKLPGDSQSYGLVTVFYFRAGYSPNDYPSEKEWAARKKLEKSFAAKCPTVAAQLVGTKKIQQVLDQPGEVERFVDTKEDAEAIRATFARQFSLSEADDGAKVAQMGIKNPEDFVLKPQREGGGNNLYSEDLKKALETMSANERSAYVLMERIRPVVSRNIVIRDGEHSEIDVVSEFGVYGVHVTAQGQDISNYAAGTLLRSKAASENDGGVAAGVAVLDSPLLVD